MARRAAAQAEVLAANTADLLTSLGTQIRDIRTQKGLTLQALAEMTDLSPSMLSLVERGKASPSIGTLMMICGALGIHMSELIASGRGSPQGPVIRAHEQPIFESSQGVLRRILRDERVRGVEVAMNEYAPNTGSSETAVHHGGFECGVVLEGELTVELDGTPYKLKAGDSIAYDSSRGHRIWNYGRERARAFWINLERA